MMKIAMSLHKKVTAITLIAIGVPFQTKAGGKYSRVLVDQGA
jgi:hypothetical protein